MLWISKLGESISAAAGRAGLLEEALPECGGGDCVGEGTERGCRVVPVNRLAWQMSKEHCQKIKPREYFGYAGPSSVEGIETEVKTDT